jgi:hypothetical protein
MLEFAEKTRLNTLRTLLLKEIDKLEAQYSPEKEYLRLVLHAVEGLDKQELETENEIELFLEMILQSVFEKFGNQPKPDTKFLKRFDPSFLRAAIHPQTLPTVPHRRPLRQQEWYTLWDKFQNKLGRTYRKFVFDEEWQEEWKKAIANPQISLYLLHGFSFEAGYELSSHWLPQMIEGDMSFWVDADFTWAVYIDHMGYWYTIGDVPIPNAD